MKTCANRRSKPRHLLAAAGIALTFGSVAWAGQTESVVFALMDAFNERDVAKMRTFWDDDIVWYDVNGDQVTVSLRGASAFESGMRDYFRSFPDAQSSLSAARESGAYLAGVETVRWTSNGVIKSQSAPVVYEVQDGKVRRVWYYPATKGK